MAVRNPPQILTNGLGGQVLWDGSGNLIVQPQSGLALQAQATTSSATGGNARGANAVDWQTARGSASQVALGQYSVLSGGHSNASTQYASTIAGGESNSNNNGPYTAILGGTGNITTGALSSIAGGYGNTTTGYYNFIGNGYANSGTANAAVTTQATTTVTSGSNAVTLSGSNASIKVGQLVTGTGINTFPHTYVTAISGTSLTLSQNATASGSPTLSFYTPHGIVVGGGNNQATGSYSFIGGGGDAGTAANRNVASGDWSFVGGGQSNIANASGSVVVGGGYAGTSAYGNTASGNYSFIGAGVGNSASGQGSSVVGGYNNFANGNYSLVTGFQGISRGIDNAFIVSSRSSGGNGAVQSGIYSLSVSTTTTGAVALSSNTSAAGSTNQVVLPNGQTSTVSVYTFRVLISAHNSANTTDIAGWQILGVISRGNGVGTTALVGTPSVTLLGATTGAISAGWGTVSNVAAVADTTNGALQIQVTGVASTTIRWSARVETNELAY